MHVKKQRMFKCIDEIYKSREDFIIIGLTGRTGSGCTTAAQVLSENSINIDYDKLNIKDKNKKYRFSKEIEIIRRFSEKHWNKFYHISIRNIISSFILEAKFDEAYDYLKKYGIGEDLKKIKYIYDEFYKKNKIIDQMVLGNINQYESNDKDDKVIEYLLNEVSEFTRKIDYVFNKAKDYNNINIYQEIGSNIRKTGCAFKNDCIMYEFIHSISRRINSFIKVIRHRDRNKKPNSVKAYFVIDTFRNPTEALFFKERYSSFYLVAINCKNDERIRRLKNKNIDKELICKIDKIEYNKNSFVDSIDVFVGQDIKQCVLYSDIFIDNSNNEQTVFDSKDKLINLKYQLLRIVTLIQHPGLIKPTHDEFIMQIAYTASANSGCLSRNVGAVVTDNELAPIAIGWNCVPQGQIPCNLRNIDDLTKEEDNIGYSRFEKENTGFNNEILNLKHEVFETKDFVNSGLPLAYCFKKMINLSENNKNQVHTRSLHAEENAYLQILKHTTVGVKKGKLYTTASPCVLCAKKTYQLDLDEVVYIDPYPDISNEHIFGNGFRKINLRFFTGVIGQAYYKLYTPLVQEKDEIYTYSK